MMFAQGFGQNSNINNNQIRELCERHVGCNGCPLKEKDVQINGCIVRCETGREK